MSVEGPQFRDKDRAQLRSQLDDAIVFAQAYLGTSLLPPSLDNDEGKEWLLDQDQALIELPYSRRMKIFTRILNTQRTGNELQVEEVEQYSKWLHALNRNDEFILGHKADEDARVLYERQFSVFEDLRDFLEDGGEAGYVKLPTGVGKTVLFVKLAEATGLRTLVVTPTKILVDQTGTRFEEFAPGVEVGKVYSYEKDYGRQVTITTYKSFQKGVAEGTIDPTDYDVLVLDEAHKALTPKRMAAVSKFDHAVRIGFTATTKYSEEKKVDNLLHTKIHTMDVREAVNEGMMAPFSVLIAKTKVDLSEVRITRSSDANERDLERVVNITSRNQGAVEIYKQLFSGQKAAVYCVSIEHAREVAKMFREAGVNAETVFGGQNRAEQNGIIEGYRSGEISVVCNADILVEGFDEPSSSVCINLRPTASPLFAEQRAGRVLRIDPNNPGKHAYIVDFIDEFENASFIPVSMAQIIEGVHVYRKASELPEGYQPTGYGTPHYPFLQIEGLKVITDVEEIMKLVMKMDEKASEKYEMAEVGWLTKDGISQRYGITAFFIKKVIEAYRESNPEYFKKALNSRGRPLEFLAPELIEIIGNLRFEMKAPIEGWRTQSAAAKEIGISVPTLLKTLSELDADKSGSVRLFRGLNGQLLRYYSPDILNLVKERLEITNIPEGWISFRDAGQILGLSEGSLIHFFDIIKLSYPDKWGRFREASIGIPRKYISPTLIQIMKRERDALPEAPEGWLTHNGLLRELKLPIGQTTYFARLFQDLAESFPNEVVLARSKTGQSGLHYSPTAISLAVEKYRSEPQPDNSWISIEQLSKELGIREDTLREWVRLARSEQEFEVRKFNKDQSGRLTRPRIYLSPKLASISRYRFAKNSESPPVMGWMSAHFLLNYLQLKLSEADLEAFVEKYRTSNPQFFKIERGRLTLNDRKREITEYFSPELVTIIWEHFGNKKPIKKRVRVTQLAQG